MIKSCYVHIPFCKTICSYCDFCKNYHNKKIVKKYLLALEKEIKENYKNNTLKTLYIGGGTPSSLLPEELETLFKILGKFKLEKDYEFTFECNYEDITKKLLVFLKNNRVNRLSIGIESFNNKFQSILNRKINKDQMLKKIKLAKEYFNNINVDLMYDLPTQTIDDLKEDIKIFKSLNVNHISTYSLIIEEHTDLKIKGNIKMDEELSLKMYNTIIKELKESGYIHYEISNFAKEGYQSKHNLTYWNNDEYYGFGAGASGFVNKIRYDNTRSINNYINDNKRLNEEKINKKQMMLDEVMLNLRKINGINKKEFKARYKVDLCDIFDYHELLLKGLIKEENDFVFIQNKYLYVSNEVILKFLDKYKLLNKS